MRITPDSVAGRRMLSWGVTERELARARVFPFDMQQGGAVTLAIGLGRAIILVRSRYLPIGPDGQLTDGRHLALVRHEFCHVNQIQRWGFVVYWIRQLWARVQTRSLLAENSSAESPCYEAQRLAEQDFS